MNKNLIIVLYFGLAGVAVIVACVVAILAPGQFDKIFSGLLQVLGLASTAAVTIYLLGTQNKTLEDVKNQTNGTLSRLHEQIAQLQQEKDDAQRQLLQVVASSPPVTPPAANNY